MKPSRKAIDDHAPWKPVDWEEWEVSALQAVAKGNADEEQQRRAFIFVVEKVCGTYQPSYRPGDEGRRDTDFAEGRRYVGLQMVKFAKLNLVALRRKENG